MDTKLDLTYSKSTFDITQDTGTEFSEKFVEKNNLKPLQEKISKIVSDSKLHHDRTPIISFCTEKGGAGKSTSSLNVARLVACLGFKVLIIDTDRIKTSFEIASSRNERIKEIISEFQNDGVDEGEVIKYKKSIDPIVYAEHISQSSFDLAVVDTYAKSKKFDLIVIDTAGQKTDDHINFDPRKISAANVPHITTAYVSNVVIVPMKTSDPEILAAQNYYVPLTMFLRNVSIKQKNNPLPYETQAVILANQIEKDGFSVNSLNSFVEQSGYDFLEARIRRSEKINNTLPHRSVETLFSTNVALSTLECYFNLVDEIFDYVETSLGVY